MRVRRKTIKLRRDKGVKPKKTIRKLCDVEYKFSPKAYIADRALDFGVAATAGAATAILKGNPKQTIEYVGIAIALANIIRLTRTSPKAKLKRLICACVGRPKIANEAANHFPQLPRFQRALIDLGRIKLDQLNQPQLVRKKSVLTGEEKLIPSTRLSEKERQAIIEKNRKRIANEIIKAIEQQLKMDRLEARQKIRSTKKK